MEKQYFFHYDLIHLQDYPEDWYGDFPVLLSDEEYNELLETFKQWKKTDEYNDPIKHDDDEYFLHQYCLNIHKKVRAGLKEFVEKHWGENAFKDLDQADIILPDEIYYDTDPDFFNDTQSY